MDICVFDVLSSFVIADPLDLKVHDVEDVLMKIFKSSASMESGIQEHIDLGIKYDPTIGIYGLDFYIVLEPGSSTTQPSVSMD